MDFLEQIAQEKKQQVQVLAQSLSLDEVRERALAAEPVRGFQKSIMKAAKPGLIAEIKRRSPSAGNLQPDLDPERLARTYEKSGAAAISVLTDSVHFGGSLETLSQVRASVSLPVLRKEFIVSAYQLYEARAANADAALLIGELLSKGELEEFLGIARGIGLDILAEAHTEEDLKKVVEAGAGLVGVNNRDLRNLEMDTGTCARLCSLIPADRSWVAESGIHTRAQIEEVRDLGACAVLIGESLLKGAGVEATVAELFG
ncbi:MAG: indole-3-glycerol phosphate synthase TrpC [Candidatus Omnitrophica bacterium]|nr:indole-3-glycerol phosphate synthase TrpC [Candidatus Omnitrophota bacterium]